MAAYPLQFLLNCARPPTVAVTLALVLCACTANQATPTSQAVEPPPPAQADTQPEPELTLNLPDDSQCNCDEPPVEDYTFLERGFDALARGEHVEAVQYFQRYQRLESSSVADWEAAIAIAYDSMLPQSPFYDVDAATRSYAKLAGQQIDEKRVHPKVLLMHDALATLDSMQSKIDKLQADNALLREDLAKREEALKRLRELTLGQRAVTP